MSVFLGIELSSPRGSVALAQEQRPGNVLRRTLAADRRHTAELLPAIRDLLHEAGLAPADVAVVCFSKGPGSFTGLRVGATVAALWQSATGARVVAVPTLDVIARNALRWPTPRAAEQEPGPAGQEPGRYIAVVTDARQGRVFGAVYEWRRDEGSLQPVIPAALHEAAAWLPALPRPGVALGDAVAKYETELRAAGLTPLPPEYALPDAAELLVLGRRLAAAGVFCGPGEVVPDYLRPPECEEVYERRRAAARARREAP